MQHIPIVIIVTDSSGMAVVYAEHFGKFQHSCTLVYAFFEHLEGYR